MRKSIIAQSIGRFASPAALAMVAPRLEPITKINPAEQTFRFGAIPIEVDGLGHPNPVNIAADGVSLLPRSRVEALLRPGRVGLEHGRAGRFRFTDWLAMGTMIHLGMGVEDRGICRGLESYFKAAYDAMQGVSDRMEPAGAWIAGPLTDAEIEAVKDLLWAYEHHMSKVSRREYTEIRAKAVAQVQSKRGTFFTGQALRDLRKQEDLHS